MAKDGLLGKDLTITYMRAGGAPFSLETNSFNETQRTEEKKKHPLGEPHEHTRVIPMGWDIDVEGEITGPEVDDLMQEIELAHRNRTALPELEVRTREVYADGTVRQWKFSADGGVRISGFRKNASNGNEARTYAFKITAARRDVV